MKISRLCAALSCVLTLSACSSAPVEHYYTLLGKPPAETADENVGNRNLRVNLASVTLPESVDRSELVIRSGANSVMVMETQRWAESLKSAVPRAIANDLSQLLGGALVSVQADNASRDAKYLLYVDVTRFDSVLNESASVDAIWSLRLPNGDQVVSDRTTIRVPTHGAGFDDLVTAHTQALALLSDEIATRIKKIDAKGQ